jgi:RNA polymerase sigma-70 factor (ECF subfamily)
MPRRLSEQAHEDLRTLFSLGTVAGLSDAQLLERFIARHDEAGEVAFTTLVQRHAPMVMGVCRRVTRDRHTAEDACQATFLVLAHKARSIAPRERLASWLYGVAIRCAQKARSRLLRQRVREGPVMPPDLTAKSDDPTPDDELLAILDEELAQLPDRLRFAVVLCELEGLTRAAAALRLGIPEGTLSSRLASARQRLHARLVRRGVTLSVAALTVALSRDVKAVAVPVRLIECIVQAAALIAAGANPSSAATASVVALTQGVLKSMLISKFKTIAAVLTAATGLAAGAAVFARQDQAGGNQPLVDQRGNSPAANPPPASGPSGPGAVDRADDYVSEILRFAREAADRQHSGDLEGAARSLAHLQRTAQDWSDGVSALRSGAGPNPGASHSRVNTPAP